MSDITEEDVMKYCYSRNLMLVTKESLEYMHRPIVIETMNKNAIPIEWVKKQIEKYATLEFHLDVDDIEARACLEYLLEDWEKENGRSE